MKRKDTVDPENTAKAQAALDSCVATMSNALQEAGGELQEGVEEWLKKYSLENFIENLGVWKAEHEKVLDASAAIGEIAARLAVVNESTTVEKRHVRTAVFAVKEHCLAGVETQYRRALCPSSLPDDSGPGGAA